MAQLGDANGDGILDVAVGIDNPSTLYIMLGKGDGTFVPTGPPTTSAVRTWESSPASSPT